MQIKNHNTFSKWKFFFKDLEGNDLSFPMSGGYSPNLHALALEVESQFEVFDVATDRKYTELIRKEAKALSKDYLDYIKILIEHQICLRHDNNNDLCWNDGLGDRLHEISGKVDHMISKFPAPLKKMAEAAVKVATKAATGKAQKKLGVCGTCGGTDSFDPNKKNLGRAGSLNNMVPSSIPKKRS